MAELNEPKKDMGKVLMIDFKALPVDWTLEQTMKFWENTGYLTPYEVPREQLFTLEQIKEALLHGWNYGDGTTKQDPYDWFKERFNIDIRNAGTKDINQGTDSL